MAYADFTSPTPRTIPPYHLRIIHRNSAGWSYTHTKGKKLTVKEMRVLLQNTLLVWWRGQSDRSFSVQPMTAHAWIVLALLKDKHQRGHGIGRTSDNVWRWFVHKIPLHVTVTQENHSRNSIYNLLHFKLKSVKNKQTNKEFIFGCLLLDKTYAQKASFFDASLIIWPIQAGL